MTDRSDPPPLSVVMSVYNGEDYLPAAIDSVLEQSFDAFEFIIIDDGSTDGSTAILRDYAARDHRIRLIEQDNTGLTVALRRGVSESRGAFVARMDADDISMPDRFERQIALLRSDPGLVAATCHVEHFFDDGTVSHVARRRDDPRLIPLYNCFSNRIGGHGQVMFRRSAYDAAGGYDASFRYAQDYDLWSRLTEHGDFGVVDAMLYRFRTGHDSISKRSKTGQAENSLRTCRREYEKLTGVPLDARVARAMRDFWWNNSASETGFTDTLRLSRAMDRAVTAFFVRRPELRALEFQVRRGIAAKWRWRIKQTEPDDRLRQALIFAIIIPWGLKALRARRRTD